MIDPTATLGIETRAHLQQLADQHYATRLSGAETETISHVNVVSPSKYQGAFCWNRSRYKPLTSQTDNLGIVTNHYAFAPEADPINIGYICCEPLKGEVLIWDFDPVARGPEYTGTRLPGFFFAHTLRTLLDEGASSVKPDTPVRLYDPTAEEVELFKAMGMGTAIEGQWTIEDTISHFIRNHTIDPKPLKLKRFA